MKANETLAVAAGILIIDELTYCSYRHQRLVFHSRPASDWALIFKGQPAMEERFQAEFAKMSEASVAKYRKAYAYQTR